MIQRLQNDLAVYGAHQTCRVRFIGIEMNSGSVLRRYTDDHVVKDDLSAVVADSDLDDLLVLYAVLDSGLGSEMDVTLSDDHAVVDLDLALGSTQDTAGSTRQIA